MSIAAFIRQARALGLSDDAVLALAEAYEADDKPRPENRGIARKPEDDSGLPLSVVIDGERFTLRRKDREGTYLYVISDSVGDLYAYFDQTAARADFAAMFVRRAARRAA